MLQDWLFQQLNEGSEDFVFQQDGAPPYWHNQVRRFLHETLPQRWIGRTGPKDLALHSWPPWSSDMTPCDFFLWGYVKERVYVPPLPCDLDELGNRITTAVNSVDRRHSQTRLGRIQLSRWCPCSKWRAHRVHNQTPHGQVHRMHRRTDNIQPNTGIRRGMHADK